MPTHRSILSSVVLLACVSACGGGSPTSPGQLSCAAVVPAPSTTLRTGEMYRFRFTVPGGANADVMLTFAGWAATARSAALTVRLYDGTRLLGTMENYQDSVVIWKSPESLFGTPGSPYALSGPAAVADFGSIVNGTIDGRVEYTVTRGSVSFDHLEEAAVMLMNRANQEGLGNPVIGTREVCR